MMQDFEVRGESVFFWVKVKPRARRERFWRKAGGEICLETTAPPVEGQANEAVVGFLAKALRLPRSAIQIQSGATSRRKLLRISARPARETVERLKALVDEPA